MKKILFYNWIDFEDVISRGGGVTVYLKNIMQRLNIKKSKEYELYFLNSGTVFNFKNKVYIEPKKYSNYPNIKSFQIVNSPIIAPANVQFSELNKYIEDEILLTVLEGFFVENKGFDIVHLHNIEGLSINILRLKEKFPETKFIFTLHNYYLFCPQVNLWTVNNENCFKKPGFPHCNDCVLHPNPNIERLNSKLKYYIGDDTELRKTLFFKFLKNVAGKIRKKSTEKNTAVTIENKENLYLNFRNKNIEYVNKYCDAILAVSEQVRNVAINIGIDNDKIIVDYIGTLATEQYAELKALKEKKISGDNIFRIAYMGYAREDKGYGFLLDGLLSLPDEIASKTELFLIAKREKDIDETLNRKYQKKEQQLKSNFFNVHLEDGYTRERQRNILSVVDLGIVPSLWEDNLPQVAVEFVAAGVPIITSNCGGAQELCGNKKYVFDSDSINSFCNVLTNCIINKCSDWEYGVKLNTLDDHIGNLEKIYSNIL